jgi:hypothetical protein
VLGTKPAGRLRARPSFVLCATALAALATPTAALGTGLAAVRQHALARTASRSPHPPAAPARTVVVDLSRAIASFVPTSALGAALDGHEYGETKAIYTPASERAMEGAGLGAVDYRLRTELGVAAWHFSPLGRWSDPARRAGYWTSSSVPGPPSLASYGYELPRRGDTLDQANDAGYSRLDDGSLRSFWKSNPYLDVYYTHESHPQWVLVDFRSHRPVDAVRIAWGTPYATELRVQWWQGPEALLQAGHPPGRWRDFPRSAFAGHNGIQTLRLARRPLPVRFLRVLLSGSSHTAPRGSLDVRDRLGYAIRELFVGRLQAGRFVDLVRHGASRDTQTVTYASSTDPWHTAQSLDRDYEQPSFTTVAHSGLTRGLPVLVPVPVLYGTPEDAVAELRYLRALGVPIAGVELGEEPNGQYASPEDYGALYLQFARAIRGYDPTLALGGPSYETSIPDFVAWPDAQGRRSWTRRFVDYLRAHEALDQLNFFSFEWYPFDDGCRPVGPQLARAAGMLAEVMHRQAIDGLPPQIPRIITEYGYSAFATRDEVELPGAVLDADVAAQFLALGGQRAYLYGYEPSELIEELPGCSSWGNLMLLQSRRRQLARVAAYWGARMLTRSWAQPGVQANEMLATSATGGAPVAAYALSRPDRRLALLLLNKDPRSRRAVRVELSADGHRRPLTGPLTIEQLSSAQYRWHAAGERGYPRIDRPPARRLLDAASAELELPPLSITVLLTGGPGADAVTSGAADADHG